MNEGLDSLIRYLDSALNFLYTTEKLLHRVLAGKSCAECTVSSTVCRVHGFFNRAANRVLSDECTGFDAT